MGWENKILILLLQIRYSWEIEAHPFVPVVPIDTNHATTQHLFTDNLPISADGPFEPEGEKADSELTAALLHESSNKPYKGMPHAGCKQC